MRAGATSSGRRSSSACGSTCGRGQEQSAVRFTCLGRGRSVAVAVAALAYRDRSVCSCLPFLAPAALVLLTDVRVAPISAEIQMEVVWLECEARIPRLC